MQNTDWNSQLDSALTDKTLTAEMLAEALRTQEETDMGPSSIGAHWLFVRRPVYKTSFSSRPERYDQRCTQVFGDLGIDAEEFFRNNLEVRDFACWATHNAEFLEFIPETRRTELVRQAYLKHGGSDDELVRAGLKVGISRDELAQMIKDRFEATPYRKGFANDVDDFLEYGLKQERDPRNERFILPEDAPWAVFSDKALEQVLLICAGKSPLYTLKERKKIEIRLGREAMLRVCSEAAKHITELPRWLELVHFACLTADDKEQIVSRIGEPDYLTHHGVLAGLITEVALSKQGEQAVLEYFENAWNHLEKMNAPATCYKTALAIVGKAKGNPNAELILDLFFVRLRQAGYIVGQVEEEFHTGKRGRRLQYVVNNNRMKYVHDDFNHRWSPTKGDRVMVNTRNGRHLTPTVALAYFYPLDKEVRD